jgi:hypothetical protein
MSFTIDLVGFDTIRERLKTASEEVFKEVNGEIQASMKTMVQKAKRDAPKDIGGLEGAITFNEISQLRFEMVCQKSYAAFMEFGTKGRYRPIPGVDASKFQQKTASADGKGFFDNILDWVKRKGFAATLTKSGKRSKSLDSTIAQEQAAFQIYLSILRHGVHPHPFFFKQLDEEQPQLLNRLQQIL